MQRPSDESTNLAGVESLFEEPHNDEHFFTMKLPPISMNLRSGRIRTDSAGASGSEYLASEKSVEMQRQPTPPREPSVEFTRSRSGRLVQKMKYVESSGSEGLHPEDMFDDEHEEEQPRRKSRPTRSRRVLPEDEDEEDVPAPPRLRRSNRRNSFIDEDDDEKMHTQGRYPTRNRGKKAPPQTNGSSKALIKQPQQSQRPRRLTRRTAARADQEEDFFPEPHSSGASADADGSLDDAPHTSSDIELEPEPELEHEPEPEEEVDGRPYSLRQRQKINYAIPPPLEDMPKPAPKNAAGRTGGRAGGYHGGGHGRAGAKGRGLGWSASGAELGRWMGMPGDDSVTIFFIPFQGFH